MNQSQISSTQVYIYIYYIYNNNSRKKNSIGNLQAAMLVLKERQGHVPVKSTSFIGDLSKDSILALCQSFTFSLEKWGPAADAGHFLASPFPVCLDLSLPVWIFNLLSKPRSRAYTRTRPSFAVAITPPPKRNLSTEFTLFCVCRKN